MHVFCLVEIRGLTQDKGQFRLVNDKYCGIFSTVLYLINFDQVSAHVCFNCMCTQI